MPPLKHPKLGEVRPSQVVFSYGVRALVDLPHLSVMVTGLEDWAADPGVARPISEERLLQTVRWQLGDQVQQLLAPPAAPQSSHTDPLSPLAKIGVPVALFPRWLFCPRCQRLAPISSGLFTRKDNPFHPDRTAYVHTNCDKDKQPAVVPARFLVACENGHVDDFPWIEFTHKGPTDCPAQLRLIEYGPSGEARDLAVQCDRCNKNRRLSEAFGEEGRARMPKCRGRRPHLRDYDDQPCDQHAKAILLGASNLWFGDVVTALAIPTESAKLAQLVADKWATLMHVTAPELVSFMRNTGALGDFVGYSDTEVWQAIAAKRAQDQGGGGNDPADLKQPEWEMFCHPAAHTPAKDFRLRAVAVPKGLEDSLAQVVLVERLREVRALIGFTRIDAPGEFGEVADAAQSRRMPLARRHPRWVPATEVRGEGIFLQFNEAKIQAWLTRAAADRRADQFHASHSAWRRARFLSPEDGNFPGLRYVLLHSFAHALMRQLALECGYTSASVRERIYSRNPNESSAHPEPMAGILIYTAAPDSEGTLGGLVSLGEPEQLRRHVRAALRSAALCASDPLCAEHLPSQLGTTVHAAACHACLFAPETSCERGNKYLDRSVLVPTVEYEDLAFFARPD
ncbi:MAG: DUF1998 domain-containing protein [Chloroflexota bacterium]|nr:DUF1998 domain-containing protein [Chloroflexota bacterium]